MELQHTNPRKWKVILRKNELDTMISALRWILNGQNGRIPLVAQMKLEEILESYENECSRLYRSSSSGPEAKSKSSN